MSSTESTPRSVGPEPRPKEPAPRAIGAAPRSKTVATWLALLVGSLGLHRHYLHGSRDPIAWLFPLPTLVGAYGFWRMREYGVEDRLGGLLVPWLGLALAAAMLSAIVYGLTPDARWQARWGRSGAASGWPVVAGVVIALALGATVAMATLAFTAQTYFEAGPAR